MSKKQLYSSVLTNIIINTCLFTTCYMNSKNKIKEYWRLQQSILTISTLCTLLFTSISRQLIQFYMHNITRKAKSTRLLTTVANVGKQTNFYHFKGKALPIQQCFQFTSNWFHCIFRIFVAIWTTQVRHQYNRLGPIIYSIFNTFHGSNNSLIICNLTIFQGNIKVNTETNKKYNYYTTHLLIYKRNELVKIFLYRSLHISSYYN